MYSINNILYKYIILVNTGGFIAITVIIIIVPISCTVHIFVIHC